jgi:phage FluMu protein Com
MIQVKSYNNGSIQFYCTECALNGEKDVNDLLVDNCVLDVEIMCPQCKDVHILYIVKCADEAFTKSLNAELIALKEEKRKKMED